MALIDLREVEKKFTMGEEIIQALNKISLVIEEGEQVTFIGPSGCGKSTLMNILGLLDSPDKGSYLLEGKEVAGLSDNEKAYQRNQKIGFVFQSFNLLPRVSALRNVEMPLVYSGRISKKIITEKAKDALTKVGLENRMLHEPNELSGGQRQRVAIARALVNNPKILLADEPTGNLDSKSGKEILTLFETLNQQGMTILTVTHDPTIAERSSRVVRLFDGNVQQDERKRPKLEDK